MSVSETPKRLIILHSRDDERLHGEILLHLRASTQEFAAVWCENDVLAGSDSEHALAAAIDSADIALLLLSSAFLVHWLQSRAHFLDKLAKRISLGLTLVPVIGRACPWTEHPTLGRLKPFPLDGTPLGELPKSRRDSILTQMTAAIKTILRSDDNTLLGRPGIRRSARVITADTSGDRIERALQPEARSKTDHLSASGADAGPLPRPKPPMASLAQGQSALVARKRPGRRAGPPFFLTIRGRPSEYPLRLFFRRDVTIGRSLDNDVSVDDARVSRHHARVVWSGFEWQLVDRGSHNGICLNGNIVAESTVALETGATISLGNTRIRFELYDPLGMAPSSSPSPGNAWSEGVGVDDALPDQEYLVAALRNAAKDAPQRLAPILILVAVTIDDSVISRPDMDSLIAHVGGLLRGLLPPVPSLARLRDDVIAAVAFVGDASERESLTYSIRCLGRSGLEIIPAWIPIFPGNGPHMLIERAETFLRDARPTS